MLVEILHRGLRLRSVRAIRGATTVESDRAEAIAAATCELLEVIKARNCLSSEDTISMIFTVTPDLTSSFPASAAREAGWGDVPLLCTTEIAVPEGLPRCLRVLIHAERVWRAEPNHVYLSRAVSLRPDLA